MTKKEKIDIQQKITDAVIAQIDAGIKGDFSKPWFDLNAGLPVSLATGKRYNGSNVFWLAITQKEMGYASNVWGTYHGWFTKGGGIRQGKKIIKPSTMHVRAGEKSTPVQKWFIKDEKKNEAGEIVQKKVFAAQYFSVFNADQVEGYEAPATKPLNDIELTETMIDFCDNYVANSGITYTIGGDQACYIPSKDTVKRPQLGQFKTPIDAFNTTTHEFGHSTGHKSRLDRNLNNRFGDQAYAMEELIAEFTSAIIAGVLGIEETPREDHAQYLQNWKQVLTDDKKAVWAAATAAQKAADYIMDLAAAEYAKAA